MIQFWWSHKILWTSRLASFQMKNVANDVIDSMATWCQFYATFFLRH